MLFGRKVQIMNFRGVPEWVVLEFGFAGSPLASNTALKTSFHPIFSWKHDFLCIQTMEHYSRGQRIIWKWFFWRNLCNLPKKKTKVLAVFFSIRFFFQKNLKSPVSADLNRFQGSFMTGNDFGVCLKVDKGQNTFKNHPIFMIFRIFENFSDFFFKNKTKKIIGIYRSELILMVNRFKTVLLMPKTAR